MHAHLLQNLFGNLWLPCPATEHIICNYPRTCVYRREWVICMCMYVYVTGLIVWSPLSVKTGELHVQSSACVCHWTHCLISPLSENWRTPCPVICMCMSLDSLFDLPSHWKLENSMSSHLHAVSQLLWYSPPRLQSLVPFIVCPLVQPAKLFLKSACLFMYCTCKSTPNVHTCTCMN